MPRHLIYAIAAVVLVLAGGAYFLYGGHGFGVDGRGGGNAMPSPPAVLDKFVLTQQPQTRPRAGEGRRRGPVGMGRGGPRGERRGERREARERDDAARDENRGGGRRQGTPAVQAAWTDAAGNNVDLRNYRGRLVVLNLWATWCGPCITELPALARAKAALANDGVAVIAVDLEKKEAADIGAFLKQHGADGLDISIDRELNLMRSFGASGLPLTIVFDGQGHEIARAAGPQKWDDPEAVAYLRELANWRPGPPERRERREREPRGRGMGRVLRHL